MKSKYDWTALREKFISGGENLADFAKEHSIKYTTLYRHYKNEGWENLKAKKSGEAGITEMDIADKLLGILDEAINDKEQFYRYIVKEKNGSDSGEEERIFGKMDMQALNNAIKALDSLSEIKRVITGEASPSERNEKNNANDKKETGVVILPEVEDDK